MVYFSPDGAVLRGRGSPHAQDRRGFRLRRVRHQPGACGRFRSIFMDLGAENNCIHVNPSAGDLPAGETAKIQGKLNLYAGTLEEAALDMARREEIPFVSLNGI